MSVNIYEVVSQTLSAKAGFSNFAVHIGYQPRKGDIRNKGNIVLFDVDQDCTVPGIFQCAFRLN